MISRVFFVLICLLSANALAELSIQITQGVDNPIPIAIVPFAWEGSGVLSEDVDQIVMDDLQQVGEFRSLSPGDPSCT